MLVKILDVASVIMTLLVVVAGFADIIIWHRFFKRVRRSHRIDIEDQKRTARQLFAISSTVGICFVILGLGMSIESAGDSVLRPTGAVLFLFLIFGGGGGMASVMLFHFYCIRAKILYKEKENNEV